MKIGVDCDGVLTDMSVYIYEYGDVALHLADNGIKVLLFDTRYNQNVTHDNIIRVYDWNNVYDKISTIEKE